MIIGTAGHIDHGKTSLVKAITGVDADRLKEEKARGITIDLGFAYWPQTDGTSIGFVDVPGHESYIHNMLAGVTGIGALMLVIAANDGIKPQTREHLAIADMLGISQGVVALTKIDLVDAETLAQRRADIHALLAETGFHSVEILPVSSVTGSGLDTIKQALKDIHQSPSQDGVGANHKQMFRMPIDRVFSMQGAGTVVTGAILSGAVETDDMVTLSPSGNKLRVRGIHAQGKRTLRSSTGDRAALNLAAIGKDDTRRGDVLLHTSLHNPTQRFDAAIRLAATETKAIAPWTLVHLHCGTGAWTARIVPLSSGEQAPGQHQLAQLVLDRPAALFGGDRFILRDASAQRTLGGGTILDIQAPGRNRRKPERLLVLRLVSKMGAVHALPHILDIAPFAVEITAFAHNHGLSPEAFSPIIKQNNLLHLPTGEGHFIFSPPTLLRFSREIQRTLSAYHGEHPDRPGLTQQRLRMALPERMDPDAFSALTSHFIKRGEITTTGAWLQLAGHVARLSHQHEALWGRVLPLLSGEVRFKPPRINALAEQLECRDETIRGLLKRLARRGDVDEVAVDQFLLRSAVIELVQIVSITVRTSADGWFNAAAFRDQLSVGRRMAILILEFFDRQGITIRKGDMRKIDPRKAKTYTSDLS